MQARRIASFAAILIVALWLPVVSAFAQTDGPNYVGATPPSTSVGAAVAQPLPGRGHGELPRTGVDIGGFALAGFGLVIIGRTMMGRRTRKSTSS